MGWSGRTPGRGSPEEAPRWHRRLGRSQETKPAGFRATLIPVPREWQPCHQKTRGRAPSHSGGHVEGRQGFLCLSLFIC